jgi:predicted transcriptional regulator
MPIFHQPRRSRYEVVNEILQVIFSSPPIERRHKTGIAYATNLTHKQTVRYLDGLIEEGLLTLTDSKPSPYYEITPKGQRYLKVFTEIEDDLQSANPTKTVFTRITCWI